MKNEAIVQSQAVSLRNLKNQIRQLGTAMSSRSQGSLPSNTEDPRREGKEHCKVINLKSEKNVDIPVDVAKKRLELNSSQKQLKLKESYSNPVIKMLVLVVKLQQPWKEITQYMLKNMLQHQW